MGADDWYVNKDSEHIDAIKAFFEFYYSEEALNLYFETYGANGPSCIIGYELPESVCDAVRVDMQQYLMTERLPPHWSTSHRLKEQVVSS